MKSLLVKLATEASLNGLPAATEPQIDFIVALMARKNLSEKLFSGSTMLTKRGASNFIDEIKLMNAGIV